MDLEKQKEIWRWQYIEVCLSYRAIDSFRTNLLALLPFGSVVGGVLILVYKDQLPPEYLVPIGVLGAIITAGLFVYELHGMLKCHRLIRIGKVLEEKLELDNDNGQFQSQSELFGVPVERCGVAVPIASVIVYGALIFGWIYLAWSWYWLVPAARKAERRPSALYNLPFQRV